MNGFRRMRASAAILIAVVATVPLAPAVAVPATAAAATSRAKVLEIGSTADQLSTPDSARTGFAAFRASATVEGKGRIVLAKLRTGVSQDEFRRTLVDGSDLNAVAYLLGGVVIHPGQPATFTQRLEPGEYQLFDAFSLHSPQPQWHSVQVGGPACGTEPAADVHVTSPSMPGARPRYSVEDPLLADRPVRFTNLLPGQRNEMLFVQLKPGATEADLQAYFDATGDSPQPPPNGPFTSAALGSLPLSPGCSSVVRLRLSPGWIDLFQMHHIDRSAHWDEVWQAMDVLVAQGKIRYVGTSNFAGWHLVAAQEAARRRNSLGIVAEQCVYNLVARHVELELLPAAAAYGIGVFAWSPLHGGLLGGVLRKLAEGTAVKSAQGRAAAAVEEQRQAIAEFETCCRENGVAPAEVALSWVLGRPHITGIVIGPRTSDHLAGAFRAWETPLPADVGKILEEIFPPAGNGKPAPEAWAR
ncbi:aldo/keto reductase [Amycolatopsis sp. NPDC059090]|uniref:aldo/keto reductase n=1 Tax=unclassified Amycolatopsis TaxID=2618356 RepID=UPI00366B82FC